MVITSPRDNQPPFQIVPLTTLTDYQHDAKAQGTPERKERQTSRFRGNDRTRQSAGGATCQSLVSNSGHIKALCVFAFLAPLRHVVFCQRRFSNLKPWPRTVWI